jgi:multisubunit Na+/H+ antiporter MnhB subunit
MYHGASMTDETTSNKEGKNMMKNTKGIIAVVAALAVMLAAVALATGPASAATTGSIEIQGIDAQGVVDSKAFKVYLNATGEKITQVVLEGKVSGGSYAVLDTYDIANLTTVTEEYAASFDGATDYIYRMSVLDNGTWFNGTMAEVSVQPYVIPMMNNDATALNLVAYAGTMGIAMCAIWYLLMRNDKTNKAERKEIARDFAIATGISFIVITAVFITLGGYWGNVCGWFGF